MTRNRLYLLTVIASLAGYIWIAVFYFFPSLAKADTHFCIIRLVTGIPCPACGSTHSALSLAHGDIAAALYWNPFGVILFLSMIIFPLWIFYDVISGKESFLRFYKNFENLVRKKWILLPALLAVLANWIWNIMKGL